MKIRHLRYNEYDNFTELEYQNNEGDVVYITFNDYYFDGSLDSILELTSITNISIIDDVDEKLNDDKTYIYEVNDEYKLVIKKYFESINKVIREEY